MKILRISRGAFRISTTTGGYDVTEGFVETLIPLVSEQSWTKSLEFNGAVRATDYSTSGFVTTWKAGLTWAPIDDIRFRLTRSRDIRAPSIVELFTTGLFVGQPLDDPFTGLIGVRGEAVTIGNPNLSPEKGDTTGIGVVLQPRFLPDFTASIDYYEIEINDAIGTAANAQQIIDLCFAGNAAFCPSIIRRPDGTIGFVNIQPINFVRTLNRGIDFELAYRIGLENIVQSWNGDLAIRWMATRYIEAYSDNGLTPPINDVGENSSGSLPRWRHRFSAAYSNDPITFSLAARAISSGTIDNSWIECDAGCPTSTVNNRTIQVGGNRLRGYFYVDSMLAYRFSAFGSDGELNFNVRNLFDEDPPRMAQLGTQGTRGNRGTADATYDMIGRSYRIGLRFTF